MILHQLQQEPSVETRSSSIAISEEETEEDEDEDDEIESDRDSVIESTLNETVQSVTTEVSPIPSIAIELSKSVQTDLSFPAYETVALSCIEPPKVTTKQDHPVSNAKKTTPMPNKKSKPS